MEELKYKTLEQEVIELFQKRGIEVESIEVFPKENKLIYKITTKFQKKTITFEPKQTKLDKFKSIAKNVGKGAIKVGKGLIDYQQKQFNEIDKKFEKEEKEEKK